MSELYVGWDNFKTFLSNIAPKNMFSVYVSSMLQYCYQVIKKYFIVHNKLGDWIWHIMGILVPVKVNQILMWLYVICWKYFFNVHISIDGMIIY